MVNKILLIFICVCALLCITFSMLLFGFSKDEEPVAVVKENVTEEVGEKVVATSEPKSHNYTIYIKKSDFKLYLEDNGETIMGPFICAVGKNSGQKTKSGDMKTPEGVFKVDEIIDSSDWKHDFKDGKGEIAGAYGPWFISLDTMNLSKGEWDGIGIHGTHDNDSLGKAASEGCIRLKNEELLELKQYVKVGMLVKIDA